MRIITTALFAIMATASAAFATSLYIDNNDRPINYEELPAEAKSFISTHFGSEEISHIVLDKDFVCSDYTVAFRSGTKLEFDGGGDWTEIDCGRTSVPEALIPQQIADYVKTNYPDRAITELKREHGNTDIKLDSGLELTFNSRYRIVDVDD